MINEHCVEKFCCEDIRNIENYEKAIADTTQTWHCHHRRECVDGVFTSRKDLIANGLYYNRPANELIFLTRTAHMSLHIKDPNTRKKLSESLKGEKNYMYGKHHTEEQKNKIRETLNKPDVKKKMSDACKRAWQNPALKQKMRDAKLGKHWYTDGVNNCYAAECPGEGWQPGLTKHKKLTY